MSDADFTRPTTDFWQRIAEANEIEPHPPYRYGYPARLPDGRYLVLPIRRLPGDARRAVASLIANQASFHVVRVLAQHMSALAREAAPTVVIGLPTLGLAFAPLVAQALGFARFVPLGYSRKFWYDEALSAPVSSLTTPVAGKRIYLDPNQVPLVRGARAVVIDDAISSGATQAAVLPLLRTLDCDVAAIVVAMKQGDAWRERLAAIGAEWPSRVRGVFDSPLLALREDGWLPQTAPSA